MSTRSAVGYIPTALEAGKGESWKGVYSHFDGYPSGVGKAIWDELRPGGRIPTPGEVQAFIDEKIKKHPSGWSSFGDTCYCHDRGEGISESNMITSKRADPLYLEWVYVVDPITMMMTIYEAKGDTHDKRPILDTPRYMKNGKVDYGHCIYWHEKVMDVDLTGTEPDWEKIQGWGDEPS